MKIIQGDSLEVMSKMTDNTFDVAFTSPPYNRKRNDKYTHYDDQINDYFTFLVSNIKEMIRVTKGNVFLNVQKNYYNKADIFRLFGSFANQICEVFIWEKSNPMPASGFNITNAYEFIIVFGDSIKSNKTYTKNHLTTSVARMHKEHKAVMHTGVAEFFIQNFTQPGDKILDPFFGTGTTGIVAEAFGRDCVGIELCDEYIQIANERIKYI